MKIRSILFIILFGLVSPFLTGQVVLHCDKPYYVSGEIIWYKTYFDNTILDGSILSMKIVDSKQNIVHNSFIKVKDKSANGYFKIPFDIRSGNYALVIESKSSLASNVRIGEVSIPIYNDISKSDLTINEVSSSFGAYELPGELKVNINIPEGTKLAGEVISAQIIVTDNNGTPVKAICSASIVDQEIIGFNEGIGVAFQNYNEPYNDLVNELFFEGNIYDNEGRAIQANVIGAYASHDDSFSFTKSSEDGSFILPRNEFSGVKELQFTGYQFEHPNIMAKLNQSATLQSPLEELRFNETIIKYLESSGKRKKINQYFKLKDKTKFVDNEDDSIILPETQANYNVQEYQDFGVMSEFAKNLMMPLRFSGDKGERKAQVINPKSLKKKNYYLNGDPLFVIDGKLTRNAEYVGSIDQSEVVDLGIIFEAKKLRERYNVMGSSGIVVINTTGRRERLPESDERNIAKVNGLQTTVDYPVSFTIASELNAVPVFEPQLYWNPDISTNMSGMADINFVQSNDKSTWRVIVVARSEDGKIGIGYLDFNSNIEGE